MERRTVYYSKKYTQQFAAVKAKPDSEAPKAEAIAKVPSKKRTSKTGAAILIICLALAIIAVLVVPLLVGGAAPSSAAAPMAVAAVQQEALPQVESYDTAEQAVAAIGMQPKLPVQLPEGFELVAQRVVDGYMLEFEYINGRVVVLFRVAQGSEDLTGIATDSAAYTTSEEVQGIRRGYTGVSQNEFNSAVWIDGDYSYALVAQGGMAAEQMRQMAQGVA